MGPDFKFYTSAKMRISHLVCVSIAFCCLFITCCQAKTAETSNGGPTLLDTIKTALGNAMDNSSPEMMKKLLYADLSSNCSLGLFKLMKGIRNLDPWAVRLLDATAKYPTGLLQGTQADLGAFDECLETIALDDYGNEWVRGQYCSLYIFPPNDTSLVDALLPAMGMSHPRVRYLC
ncbi:uncharacterized protein LOC144101025 [Amblyomma americanum]